MASQEAVTKPITTRKRKTEIKKLEEANKRHVTFSKRKLGFFNKVTELSILCEAETALIISSQNGKLYACGYPNPDVVIQRFLSREGGSPQNHAKKKQRVWTETLRVEYEALQQKLKEEKEYLNNAIEAQKTGLSSPFWWNNNIDEMSLEDLEQFKNSLEQLKLNLVAATEQKKIMSSMIPMPMPLSAVSMTNLLDQCYNGHQTWDWNNTGSCSNTSMNGCFNGYQPWDLNNGVSMNGCFNDHQEWDHNNGNSHSDNIPITPNAFGNYCVNN